MVVKWQCKGKPQKKAPSTPSVTLQGGTPTRKHNKGHIVIPYTQGLGESIKKTCSKYGIKTHSKGNRTIKQIFDKPKDKDPMDKKSRAIYYYQCGELTYDEEFIRETSRTFGERFKEHLKEPSPSTHTAHRQGIVPPQTTSTS